MSGKTLKGDRCQCGGCGEYFNSTRAFDKHRTGNYGVDRRCMSVDEMREKGMAQNSGGWWITKAFDNASRGYPWARISASAPSEATLAYPVTAIDSTLAGEA